MFRSHVWVPQRKRSNHSPFWGSGARHLFISVCFWLFGGGGRRGRGHERGPEKKRRGTQIAKVGICTEIFSQNTLTMHQMKRVSGGPKRIIWAGVMSKSKSGGKGRPRFGTGSAEMRPQKPMPTSVRPCLALWIPSSCAKAGTTGPVSEFRRLVLRIR